MGKSKWGKLVWESQNRYSKKLNSTLANCATIQRTPLQGIVSRIFPIFEGMKKFYYRHSAKKCVCIFSEDGELEHFTTGITVLYEFQSQPGRSEDPPAPPGPFRTPPFPGGGGTAEGWVEFAPWLVLLRRLERSTLGSIHITDVKSHQFTVIRGDINMHDMDDVFIYPSRPQSVVHWNCDNIIKRLDVRINTTQCVAAVLQ